MALEATLIEMSRKINSLQTMVNDHNRRLIHAPLHAGPSKVLTITSGAVGATRPYIHLVPESGITDTLDSITNGSDGKVIVISNSRVGDTITINPYTVGGGNIDLNGATAAYDLDNVHESITLIYRESTLHWELVSGGVIPSGSIGAHAPSHQHGGTDEVATATPAANAIPKAGAGGDLDIGWINQADILTDNITASATNNFISDAELVKLAGIEALADVTDQANVGAAIDTSPEQTVLASGNKIAMTDAGVLEWVDWDTIVATLNDLYVDLTTNQDVGGVKTFTSKLTGKFQGINPWFTAQRAASATEQFAIYGLEGTGRTSSSGMTVPVWTTQIENGNSNFMISTVLLGGTGGKIILDGNVGIGTNTPNANVKLEVAGNILGKYSSGLDFAFYTGTDTEVMGNAYWSGTAYRRYITGRAAKVTVGDEGWFRVFTNDATDVTANITWGDARLTIDNRGTMAFGTVDIEAWSTLYPAIALGGSSGIMASATTSGLYILEGVYYDGLFKYKNATIPPTLIAMTSSGINFYANAAGTADVSYSPLHKMNIQPGGVVIGGFVTHNQPLTINHAAGAPGIEWSIADVAKAYIGVAQTTDHWVVGSVANDFVIRAVGGAIIFTVDNGAGRTLKIHTTGLLESRAGGAAVTETITIGGTLFANGAVVQNSGSAETDLKTFTIPASTLRTDGDELVFEDFGTYAANANNKLVSFYVNGTMVHNRLSNANTGTWHVRAVISRFSSTNLQVVVTMTMNQTGSLAGVSTKYASVATTLSSSFIIKTTGDGDATGDISSAHASVKYFPFNS